jgi:agmatinase
MSEPFRAALIGAPTDVNSSYLRGAARGPEPIRRALFSDAVSPASELGPEFGADMVVIDRGDLALDESEADDARIRDAVASALREGLQPILLGGDHWVTAPAVDGAAAELGPVEVLHFDAHPDLYDAYDGNRRSHASPFARIMERGLAKRLVQVGVRTINQHLRAQIERFGVEVISMREFAPERVPVLSGPLYVSIDLDGLDPAYAPGVAHHEPGGLSVRDILNVLWRQTSPLMGADVVELNPDRDVNGMTAMVAAKLVRELCGYGATRRS